MRLLLHRGFLKLVTLNNGQGLQEAGIPATRCIQLAFELIEVITQTMSTGSSGTLQAALFSALGYLWNATITLFLYMSSDRAQRHLNLGHEHSQKASNLVESACQFFIQYQTIVPFAEAAASKSRRFLEKMVSRATDARHPGRSESTSSRSEDVQLEDPNELFEKFFTLDTPLSGIAGPVGQSFDPAEQYYFRSQQFNASTWNEDGESYTFDVPES